jgi:hypothetical protein
MQISLTSNCSGIEKKQTRLCGPLLWGLGIYFKPGIYTCMNSKIIIVHLPFVTFSFMRAINVTVHKLYLGPTTILQAHCGELPENPQLQIGIAGEGGLLSSSVL